MLLAEPVVADPVHLTVEPAFALDALDVIRRLPKMGLVSSRSSEEVLMFCAKEVSCRIRHCVFYLNGNEVKTEG